MKLLFFDIECANCFNNIGKICEFGYILTDENFNETDRQIFLINPKERFDWYVVKKMLAYDKKDYLSSPDYPHYFDKIKALFADKDVMIFGHTVNTDMRYLNDEAGRYGLPYFDCKFYDAKFMYNTYANTPGKSFGVARICTELGIELPGHEHRSVDDAYATMLIVKEICKRMDVDVHGLIERCEDCVGQTENGVIKTVFCERERIRREEREKKYRNYVKGINRVKLLQFMDAVKPQGEILTNELTGKKLCISRNYERTNYKQMVSVVQLLKNCGCTYCFKASEADYFVTYRALDEDGNEKDCMRLKSVNIATEQGAAIKIITFDEFLNILGVTTEEIEAMPYPDESWFVGKSDIGNKKRESRKKANSGKRLSNTLGDALKSNGVDLYTAVSGTDDEL